MTWQVEHTIPYVDDGTAETQETAALKYFFDTFLPSKGWTVGFRDGEDATSNYRIFQRNYTDLFTGTPDKHYLWVNIASRLQYEDSTYTTTPGDLGTDTSNSVQFSWHDGSEEWTTHSYKFWGSTENSKAFLVTRWDTVLAWDLGNDWPTYRPSADQSVGPSLDRWDTCVWLAMKNNSGGPARMHLTNLPYNTPTSTTEGYVYMGPIHPKESLGSQYGFWDTVEFLYDSDGARAVVKAADIRWLNYQSGNSTGITSKIADMTTMLVAQVNGGDYWLFTMGSSTVSSMCLNIGASIPDFE